MAELQNDHGALRLFSGDGAEGGEVGRSGVFSSASGSRMTFRSPVAGQVELSLPGGVIAAEASDGRVLVTVEPADGVTPPATFPVTAEMSEDEIAEILRSPEVEAARAALATPETVEVLSSFLACINDAGWFSADATGDVAEGPNRPRIDPCEILFLRIIVAYGLVVLACFSPPPIDLFACGVAVTNAALLTAQYEAQCR